MKKNKVLLILSAVLLVAAVVAQDSFLKRCRHRGGQTVAVDLGRAEKEVGKLGQRIRKGAGKMALKEVTLDQPFDAKLPRCTFRRTREFRMTVPERLLGKTVLWSDGPGRGDLVMRTRAGTLTELIRSGALPGTREVAGKWGVRCVPSRVRMVARDRVEILEGE